jgi:hypothetical protein
MVGAGNDEAVCHPCIAAIQPADVALLPAVKLSQTRPLQLRNLSAAHHHHLPAQHTTNPNPTQTPGNPLPPTPTPQQRGPQHRRLQQYPPSHCHRSCFVAVVLLLLLLLLLLLQMLPTSTLGCWKESTKPRLGPTPKPRHSRVSLTLEEARTRPHTHTAGAAGSAAPARQIDALCIYTHRGTADSQQQHHWLQL